VFVPKPDCTLRMGIDYRALNGVTRKSNYALPRVGELVDHLTGAKYFAPLDLTSGQTISLWRSSARPTTALNTLVSFILTL
jgi:hypothetical protein